MTTREERRAALIRKFKELAAERIDKISLGWVRVEQVPDDANTTQELLRELHTLKGESKTVGFADVSLLAHRVEGLLHRAQKVGFRVPRETSDLVLKAVDSLGVLIRRSPTDPAVSLDELISRLDSAPVGGDGPAAAPEAAVAPAPTPQVAPPPAQVVTPAPPAQRLGTEESIRVRLERIASISDVTAELQIEHSKTTFSIAALRRKLRAVVEALEAGDSNRVAALGQDLEAHAAELDELSYRQGLHVQALDRTVRDLRLVPVSTLLLPYARMVRDLALEHGKEAALSILGGEVEADRRVLEVLQEPLLHLLRNCVDHGIESPTVRKAKGKPPAGRVTVQVRSASGAMSVTVEDDGGGLDPELLRQKAIDRGFLNAASAQSLSPQECLNLVFLPGFSTRDEATQTSGRGVGMDVVKRRVEELGGRVHLGGAPGRGIRLEMLVPIAISLTRALVLESGGQLFAVPSAAVESLRRLEPDEQLTTHSGRGVNVGGTVLAVASLDELLSGGGTPAVGTTTALVLRSGSSRCVLKVSSPGREVDVVVKPLGPPLREFHLVSGAAVLESGRMALMLDVAELVAKAQGRKGAEVRANRARPPSETRVLLVDDSVIFRSTISSLVQGLGYLVFTANDGLEGLAALEREGADLVITDVQMPRLDGLGLIRKVRTDPRFRALPMVVLSSLGSAEDRQRAAEAGADAYLVKNEMSESQVAEALQRLLR